MKDEQSITFVIITIITIIIRTNNTNTNNNNKNNSNNNLNDNNNNNNLNNNNNNNFFSEFFNSLKLQYWNFNNIAVKYCCEVIFVHIIAILLL